MEIYFGPFIISINIRRRPAVTVYDVVADVGQQPSEVTLHTDFNYFDRRYLTQQLYNNTGRYNNTRVWIVYEPGHQGRSFNSPVDLYDLRIFCRKAGYDKRPLGINYWTRNAAVRDRPAGSGIFSSHQYKDLMAEMLKHGFVTRKYPNSKTSPYEMTAAGVDFCHTVIQKYPVEPPDKKKDAPLLSSLHVHEPKLPVP